MFELDFPVSEFIWVWLSYTNAFIESICHGFYLKKKRHKRLMSPSNLRRKPHHTDLMKREIYMEMFYNVNEGIWNMYVHHRMYIACGIRRQSSKYCMLHSIPSNVTADLIWLASSEKEKDQKQFRFVCV